MGVLSTVELLERRAKLMARAADDRAKTVQGAQQLLERSACESRRSLQTQAAWDARTCAMVDQHLTASEYLRSNAHAMILAWRITAHRCRGDARTWARCRRGLERRRERGAIARFGGS